MPPMLCERALYTSAFLAWLVAMKFVLLGLLARVRLLLASQGVHLSMGTLVHLIARAAALAREHMKQLKAGPVICFDGTELKVLVERQREAWDGYLEVFTRDEISVFQFDMTKHTERGLFTRTLTHPLGDVAGHRTNSPEMWAGRPGVSDVTVRPSGDPPSGAGQARNRADADGLP